jgi:hypothetical protein
VSVTRQQRRARQLERVSAVFDEHAGGLSRAMAAHLADIPEKSMSSLMAALRRDALEIGRTAMTLQIGGEWIYGWAESLQQHRQEHYKRRKNERRSLLLTIETLTQSVAEHPDAGDLRRQLTSAKHRLEDVELQMEELSGQLRLIRQEMESDAA